MISAEKIKKIQKDKGRFTLKIYDSLDSTNTEAKRLADKDCGDTVIIARSQSAGRGRMGRSFYSENGLYISFLIKCGSDKDILSITAASAVSVCRAIKRAANKDTGIKWVNDLYLDNKKVCGILSEGIWDNKIGKIKYVVIGIGINCGECNFPEEIADIAGSIGMTDINCLAAELICEMEELFEMIEKREWQEEYRSKSIVIGKEIKILQSGRSARVMDIDDFGGLVIKTDEGTETLSTGEISIRLNNI